MLVDRIRLAPAISVRDSRETHDGYEAVVVDPSTGQLALLTLSPINSGTCPGCGHVSHNNHDRCEAISTVTKAPCRCAVWRFPQPNDERVDARSEKLDEYHRGVQL